MKNVFLYGIIIKKSLKRGEKLNYLLFLQGLRQSAGEWLTYAIFYISDLTSGAMGMIVPALLYWCVNKNAGAYMMMSYAAAANVNQTIKNTACIYRPFIKDSRLIPFPKAVPGATGYSFPSGHTTNAVSLYGSFALWQRKRKWVTAICVFMILFTGFARNWVGVHSLPDVLVALLVSGIVLAGVSVVFGYLETHPEKDYIVVIVGMILTAASLIFCSLKSHPVDYLPDGSILVDPEKMKTDCFRMCGVAYGFLGGWLIERRFIKFGTDISFWNKVLRFVIGFAIVLPLYAVVFPIILSPIGEHFGKMLKYFFTFLIITAGYPALFTVFEKHIKTRKIKKTEAEAS